MRLFIVLISVLTFIKLEPMEQEPTNKHFWYTLETSASPEQIWQIWTDVENWKTWDIGLQDAQLAGNFQLDQKGIITSLEGRKSKFKIVEMKVGESYTYKTNLPLGSLYVKRYMTSKEDQTVFTHEVWFSGLTKGIFAKAFGAEFREMLPQVLQNIKQIAEENDRY